MPMRASLRYSVTRLLIFLAALLLCALIPPLRENPILLLLVAGTVSMLIALFGLAGMRNDMANEVADKVESRHLRHGEKWADEVNEDFEDTHPEPHAHAPAEDLSDGVSRETR